jgi:hypothetical protein
MPLQELSRQRWQPFFDEVSKSLRAQRVKVEVTGLGLGDRIAADWIPLDGFTYDPNDDALTVFAEGLEHHIRHPRRIHVDQDLASLHSVEAVDAQGDHHIVLLSAPLALTGP